MTCAFVGVSLAHARIEFTGLTLWGLTLWGLAHMLGGLVVVGDEVLYGMQLVPGLMRFDLNLVSSRDISPKLSEETRFIRPCTRSGSTSSGRGRPGRR
jgi:hypothetical protein